jgi:hypothetical protein
MMRPLEPNPPNIELLIAAERQLVPEPDDLRDGAVERARAALPRNPRVRIGGRAPRWRGARIGLAAAAAVLLFAVCATAFIVGYQIRTDGAKAQAERPSVRPSSFTPAPLAGSAATDPEPPLVSSRSAKPKSAAAKKSAIDVEAYAAELRVLRPAQQAVSRGEFTSALAAVVKHQRRFASGQLAEEREALRVKALLGLGRTADARRAGAGFRQRFPHSALLGRIDEMLESPR